MDSNSDTSKTVQELQTLEQHLQAILMEKQTLQVQLNEATNALDEVKKSGDEIYRILAGVMLRAEKSALIQELEEKKRVIELHIQSIEKQETLLGQKADELRRHVNASMTKQKR